MLRSCDRKNIEKIRDYLNSNNFKQRVRNHGVEPLIRYHEYNNEFRAPTIYIDLSNNDGNIIKDLALKIYDKFKEKFGNEFEVLFDDRYQFTTFTSSLIIPFNSKNLNIIQGNIENAFPLSAPIEKNVDAKKMFEKISKKYPEIKGILSNNPKWENSDNVFNQNKDLTYQQVEKLFDETTKNTVAEENVDNKLNSIVEIFNKYPELSKIGTYQEYSEYLDTIFPNSKIKDIVYHGTMEQLLPKDGNFKGYITYFTTDKKYAETFGVPVNRKVVEAVLDIKDPYNSTSELADVPEEIHDKDEYTNPRIIKATTKGFDSVIGVDAGQEEGKTIAVFNPEQIHILGSKQDIKGFKEFINHNKELQHKESNNQNVNIIEDLLPAANTIKTGVSKLFESNPELANQVYSALGFQGSINLESNLKNTGKTEQELTNYLKEKYPEIKLEISNNPIWEQSSDIVKNQEDYRKEVQYRLKATEILLSDKAKQVFNKGNKNNWSLDKILTELAIPKEQKRIILDLNDEDYSFANFDLRESIIIALLSNYSYTVEINTAKDKREPDHPLAKESNQFFAEQSSFGWWNVVDKDDNIYRREIKTKEAAEKYAKELNEQGIPNTQYYYNLTVPGGTNYTENEISTPLITPSIKGHAQFSTNKGIGWFRSDEQAIVSKTDTEKDNIRIGQLKEMGYSEKEISEMTEKDTGSQAKVLDSTKTRRILEVQSDLFQKGRDKEDLTGIPTNKVTTANLFDNEEFSFELNGYEYDAIVENIYYAEENQTEPTTVYYKNGVRISSKEMQIAKEEYKKQNIPQSQNQFLQLLNKDNNWVTFFIKSIIQDSAKKGYEKVLFPKGETAAKIEGHETIADRLNWINKRLEQINKELFKGEVKENFIIETRELYSISDRKLNFKINNNQRGVFISDEFKTKEDAQKWIDSKGNPTYEVKINLTEDELNIYQNNILEKEGLEKEKQELKSQGIEKLKPIEAFYEIKVGNILEKQFGKENVKTITDEYGNQWREITINQARDLDNILLQKNEANRIIGQANIKAMTVLVDAVNKKEDTIPHEYAHHYIAWFRNTPIVQEAIKRFGSEEALVQAIGEQVVKQKGEAYNWWKKFTNWILNLLSDKQLLQVLTDSFLNRQDLHDFTYNQPNTQQKQQAIEIYSKYLDTIFPDSKVRGIVYHGSSEKREILDPTKQVRGRFGQGVSFAATPQLVNQLIDDAIMHYALIDLKNPLTDIPSFRADVQPAVEQGNHDGVQVGNIEFTVPTKEQIHILGSKQDIEGFKKFTKRQSNDINNQENNNIEQSQINENNTESFTKESLNKKIDELLKSGEIYYTDDDSKPCAANGLRNTVKGTDWKIATEFKGKSHAQGGIDITLNENGYHFRRGGKDIKAANGLIIENK